MLPLGVIKIRESTMRNPGKYDQDVILWWGILVFVCFVSHVYLVGRNSAICEETCMAAGDCWNCRCCSQCVTDFI